MSVESIHSSLEWRLVERYGTQPATFELEDIALLFSISAFTATSSVEIEKQLQRYGLSQGRFMLLLCLNVVSERTWTPATLAAAAAVSRATITGLLDGLEQDTWIARTPNPNDKRSTQITLTDTGASRLEGIIPDYYGRIGDAFSDLTALEKELTGKLMRKVLDCLEKL